MLSRSNRSNEMPILATIIFAEKLSEGRGPQATTGEAEQSDTTSTDAIHVCAYTLFKLEIDHHITID